MEIFIFSVCHPPKLRAPASEISLKPAHVQKLEIICKALMGSKGRRRRLVNRKVQARQKKIEMQEISSTVVMAVINISFGVYRVDPV